MAILRAQVVLPMFTNTPEDVVTNTLYFEQNTPVDWMLTADAVTPYLETFYESIFSGTDRLANYIVPAAVTVRWYNMDEPEPRVPYIVAMGLESTVSTSIVPTEASIVLSFQGDREAGVPQARRRGRIYIGGLGQGCIAASSGSTFPTVGSGVRTSITNAATALRDGVQSAAATWVVWSPTTSSATEVTNGWVDNAIDTQRRRSVERTARTLWS